MLACKSCCPKLSWEQQPSESWWFWKDKIYLIFCLLKLNLTAVLESCVFVETVCNSGLIKLQVMTKPCDKKHTNDCITA